MPSNRPRTAPPAAFAWFNLAVVAVVALTILAFSPAASGPQIFDDHYVIQDNPSIARLWPIDWPAHPPPNTPVTGRPVVNYSFALNYWFNQVIGVDQRPDPDGINKTVSYDWVNLGCHILCGLLILGIIRRTLRVGRLSDRLSTSADAVALLVTALWLLHPMQTEAVDYLTQRTELLVSLFLVATLYCSIRAWDADRSSSKAEWFCAGVVASCLGMASKEVMVSAPILIILYDRAFRLNSWREIGAPQYRSRRWFYGALTASWIILAALLASRPRGAVVGFASAMPWYEYLHTQGWAIAHYLRLAFVPTALSLDYGFHPIPHWRGLPGLILLGALAALTVAAWRSATRWGWLGFLGAWFFLILAPSSSIVPIITEPIAERRMYLPLAAVLAGLIVLVSTGRAKYLVPRAAAAGAAVLVVLLLAAFTYQRSALYRDPEAIWRDAINKVPSNARGYNNLGAIVASLPVPRPQEAESLYREALELDPTYTDALLNAAMNELSHGASAEAEQRFRQILALDPSNHFALGGLGNILLARNDTIAALPLMEGFATGTGVSADYFALLGQVYLAGARVDDAATAFHRAILASPSRTDLMVYLGWLLLQVKRPEQAIPYLEEAVRREANSGVDLALLSLAYADAGRSDQAVRAAANAEQLGGRDGRTLYFAGRAMLDSHHPDLAERYLTPAVGLNPRDPDAIASLGEAKAALGKQTEAASLFNTAIRIDPTNSVARAGLGVRP